MGYGERIRQYRELRDLTQDDLARRTGIPSTAISRIERGGRKVTLDEAVCVASVLGVNLLHLAGITDTVGEESKSKDVMSQCAQEVDHALGTLLSVQKNLKALVAS